MSELTPEQQSSALKCDALTDAILEATAGMPVGVVVGACLNVLDTAASYCLPEDRKKIAARMHGNADKIEADENTPAPDMPNVTH
jgi:hypothetical protein